MVTITSAYDAAMILCHTTKEGFGYTYHQGNYHEDTEFKILPCYSGIPTREPQPGIADMIWYDMEESEMILKYSDTQMVEVRKYDDIDLFKDHVAKIKEIEGVE